MHSANALRCSRIRPFMVIESGQKRSDYNYSRMVLSVSSHGSSDCRHPLIAVRHSQICQALSPEQRAVPLIDYRPPVGSSCLCCPLGRSFSSCHAPHGN